MNRMAQTRGQDLGFPFIVVVNLDNLLEQSQAVVADVVQPTEEGTDKGRACLRRANRLGRGEAERHVHLDSFVVQDFSCFQAVDGEWALDDHVWRNLHVLAPLLHHLVSLIAGRFSRDRARNDLTNLGDVLFEINVSFF